MNLFDVRVAGGHPIARRQNLGMASAVAYSQVRHGYRVWIREITRHSVAAELIIVRPGPNGTIIVENADGMESRFVPEVQRIIEEIDQPALSA